MRPIWRFFDGLTTIKETLIFQGALLEFHINGHEAYLDLPGLPQRIKDSDKLWAEGAKLINVMDYVLFLMKKNLMG